MAFLYPENKNKSKRKAMLSKSEYMLRILSITSCLEMELSNTSKNRKMTKEFVYKLESDKKTPFPLSMTQ